MLLYNLVQKGGLLVEESEIYKKLNKDIKELEEELKDAKSKKIKVKTTRNLKITARLIQLLAPYVTTSLVLAGGFKYANNTPIVKDNERLYLTAYEEVDSDMNFDLDTKYEKSKEQSDKLVIITKWHKEKDCYERKISVYDLNNISPDIIFDNIENSPEEILNHLKEPITSKIEITKKLTSSQLKEKDYYKAMIRYEFKDEFMIVEENDIQNLLSTVAYLLATTLVCEGVYYARKSLTKYSFTKEMEKIKSEYRSDDIDRKIKRLEIKKDTYKRLYG